MTGYNIGERVRRLAETADGPLLDAVSRIAVWGVMHHFGGRTDPTNPGSGDLFDELAPVALPED